MLACAPAPHRGGREEEKESRASRLPAKQGAWSSEPRPLQPRESAADWSLGASVGGSGEVGASPRLWTTGGIGPGSSDAPGSFSPPWPSRPQLLCRLARPRFPAGAGGAHEAAPGSRAAACPAGREPAAAAPVRAAVGAGNRGTRPPSRSPSATRQAAYTPGPRCFSFGLSRSELRLQAPSGLSGGSRV